MFVKLSDKWTNIEVILNYIPDIRIANIGPEELGNLQNFAITKLLLEQKFSIHLFNNYLLSTNYIPHTLPSIISTIF